MALVPTAAIKLIIVNLLHYLKGNQKARLLRTFIDGSCRGKIGIENLSHNLLLFLIFYQFSCFPMKIGLYLL